MPPSSLSPRPPSQHYSDQITSTPPKEKRPSISAKEEGISAPAQEQGISHITKEKVTSSPTKEKGLSSPAMRECTSRHPLQSPPLGTLSPALQQDSHMETRSTLATPSPAADSVEAGEQPRPDLSSGQATPICGATNKHADALPLTIKANSSTTLEGSYSHPKASPRSDRTKPRSPQPRRSRSRSPRRETLSRSRTSLSECAIPIEMDDNVEDKQHLGPLMQHLFQSSGSPGMVLVWHNLAVQGQGSKANEAADMWQLLLAPLSLFKLLTTKSPPPRSILHPTSGTLRPGETLLVLGRPGSGCTTFLKTLASYSEGYHAVHGQTRYSYLGPEDVQGLFRGEVAYLAEDDVHFPTLTVQQTMDFINYTRAPSRHVRPHLGTPSSDSRKTYGATLREALASVLGLKHTYHTKVGDAVLRGVSGGEKKRVSLYEGMALTAKILLLDNPSRGLDSKTAAEVAQVLRTVAQASQVAVAAAMYQAGEPVFATFDKVCLLNRGHVVYFGPARCAVPYFIKMGYEQLPHQTSADFLVSLTDPLARKIRQGYEQVTPLHPEEMQDDWERSSLGAKMSDDVQEVLHALGSIGSSRSQDGVNMLKHHLNKRKARGAPKNSPFLTTWATQIRLCFYRRYLMQIGDPVTHIIMMIAMFSQGLIFGSVLYQIPKDTHGFFSRASAVFFMLLFTSFLAQTEIMIGYAHRPIVIRHRRFGMARASADSLANSLLDLLFRSPCITVFVVTMYFMCGLGASADQFFIALFIVFLHTELSVALNRLWAAMFRDMPNAAMVAGLLIIDFALYAGYAIPRPSMVKWWRWLSYWNPMSMAVEVILSSEFRKLNVRCTDMVPAGPSYDSVSLAHRTCALAGIAPGLDTANGAEYLKLQYDFDWAHRWRLVFLLLGIWVAAVLSYAVACEFQKEQSTSTGTLLFAPKAPKVLRLFKRKQKANIESTVGAPLKAHLSRYAQLHQDQRVLTFEDVCYDVPISKQKHRRLLHSVTGCVPPGQLTAIMGSSGSGKTTLMNVLAQRTSGVGVISGSILCDGQPLPLSFPQETGYCEQMDTHLATTTVREALQFSALLRQTTGSKAAKLAWCEEVLELLDMMPWADAMVGNPGENQCLSVEQRKRLTIAVELAAKPRLLLFLDEPTSGMDTLAAWSIVQLLKRLASAGQSILCTIHQPSGELLAQFDRLLLLHEGKVVYQGPVHTPHRSCGAILDYFESLSGRICGKANPAEFMLDCLSEPSTESADWPELFAQSQQAERIQSDVLLWHSRRANRSVKEVQPSSHECKEYGASTPTQCYVLLLRTWVHFWRSPTYLGSKFALNLIAGLFVGSSFWNAGHKTSVASLQVRMFSHFVANVLGVPLAQHMLPTYVEMRSVFETREKKAKIYSWAVFQATFLAVEIPWDWLCGLAYWIPWEFMSGNAGSHSWSLLWFIPLYSTFWPTLGILIQNMVGDAMLGGVLYSSLYSFCIMFSGTVQAPSLMPGIWRGWMFDLTPLHYYMEGQLGNALAGQPIQCSRQELVPIIPPPGESCGTYLANFCPSQEQATEALKAHTALPGVGYWYPLTTGGAEVCGWCPYTQADQFMETIGMRASHRKRDVWIFFLYLGFNLVGCFVSFYLFRMFSPRGLLARWRQRRQRQREREALAHS